MFNKKKKNVVLEAPIGTLIVKPDWSGKFYISEYCCSEYSGNMYWGVKTDYFGNSIYFDTKEEAIARIEFMNKKDKYNESATNS